MTLQNVTFREVENLVDEITNEPSVENERRLLRLRDTATIYLRQARELQALVEARIIEYMQLNECDIAISDEERLYVGTTKVTKSVDDQGILMAVLEAGKGNLGLLTTGAGGVLASQPWKHGAVTELIGQEKADDLFRTTVKLDLKTGLPVRSLKVSDSRFYKSR